MTTVKVNGVELYYETAGDGPRIALTHGGWSDGRAWEAVAKRLVDRFEVVMWDRRGHSRSGDGEGPGSVRQDAADLAALIEHMDSGPVHLVGNSSGGIVVLNLVTMRPDLARSAAVHEPVLLALLEDSDDPHIADLVEQDKRHLHHVQELIAGGEHRRAAQYFVEEVAAGPGAWDQFPPELRDILESNALTVPDDLRDSFDIGSVDLDALVVSKVPLSISHGSHSPGLEAAAAKTLAGLLPAARLEVVDGAGHIPHRTHPDDYAAMLAAFLGRLAPIPPAELTPDG